MNEPNDLAMSHLVEISDAKDHVKALKLRMFLLALLLSTTFRLNWI